MLISKAKTQDVSAIKKLWIDSFPLENERATQFYFETLFRIEDTYVMKIHDELVCMLQTRPMQIMLEHPMTISFIVGVATLKQQQHKGYMKKLLQAVLEKLEKEEPVTLLQAYQWDLYKPFGFEIAYYHNRVILDKDMYRKECAECIVDDQASSDELLKLYELYTKDKNGYRIRSEAYYDLYLKPYSTCDGENWLCIRTIENELIAYAIYEDNQQITVTECIVKNQEARYILMKKLLAMKKEVIVYCCEEEQLYGKTEKVPTMMVRNNSAYKYKKPLFINEVL